MEITTNDLIKHFDKMAAIAEMIIAEVQKVTQLENIKNEKCWFFYTPIEKMEALNEFDHQIDIHKMALERLKNYYINNSKLN